MAGQAGINERLINQEVSLGKIDTTLGFIREDLRRHDREIVDVEQQAQRIEVGAAETAGRRGAMVATLKIVWAAKQYWLIPALAAAVGYLARYLGK
jgi:hypothetical protein